jgi:hypothetical protein
MRLRLRAALLGTVLAAATVGMGSTPAHADTFISIAPAHRIVGSGLPGLCVAEPAYLDLRFDRCNGQSYQLWYKETWLDSSGATFFMFRNGFYTNHCISGGWPAIAFPCAANPSDEPKQQWRVWRTGLTSDGRMRFYMLYSLGLSTAADPWCWYHRVPSTAGSFMTSGACGDLTEEVWYLDS